MANAVKTRSSLLWSCAGVLPSSEGLIKDFELNLKPIWEDKDFE